MATWPEDVAQQLAQAGFGTYATDIFALTLPDSVRVPGNVIAVVPYPGRQGVHDTNTSRLLNDYPRFNLFSRGAKNDNVTPLTKAEAIYLYLASTFGFVIGGNSYPGFVPLEPPYPVGGEDETGRYLYTFRVEATRNL